MSQDPLTLRIASVSIGALLFALGNVVMYRAASSDRPHEIVGAILITVGLVLVALVPALL
jgi:hypothetical protein